MTYTNTPQSRLFNALDIQKVSYNVFEHPACRTSQESRAARSAAGFPRAEGAKALICRTEQNGDYVLLVLPGTAKLDNAAARKQIGKFRFATPEEVASVSGGLCVGTIPPFSSPVLPGVRRMFVDEKLFEFAHVGFNAAALTRSVVMASQDYAKFVPTTSRCHFSCP